MRSYSDNEKNIIVLYLLEIMRITEESKNEEERREETKGDERREEKRRSERKSEARKISTSDIDVSSLLGITTRIYFLLSTFLFLNILHTIFFP